MIFDVFMGKESSYCYASEGMKVSCIGIKNESILEDNITLIRLVLQGKN